MPMSRLLESSTAWFLKIPHQSVRHRIARMRQARASHSFPRKDSPWEGSLNQAALENLLGSLPDGLPLNSKAHPRPPIRERAKAMREAKASHVWPRNRLSRNSLASAMINLNGDDEKYQYQTYGVREDGSLGLLPTHDRMRELFTDAMSQAVNAASDHSISSTGHGSCNDCFNPQATEKT